MIEDMTPASLTAGSILNLLSHQAYWILRLNQRYTLTHLIHGQAGEFVRLVIESGANQCCWSWWKWRHKVKQW